MHFTYVPVRCRITCKRRDCHWQEHICCLLIIIVCAKVKTIVKESGIHTYIPTLCFLPMDILIRIILLSGRHRRLGRRTCTVIHNGIIERNVCLIRIISNPLVTERTDRGTELQIVYRGYVLHELLVRDDPTHRCGREESPTVILVKTWRSVFTSIELEVVTAVVIIHDTAKKWTVCILIRIAGYGKSILVRQIKIRERRQRHIVGRSRHRFIRIAIIFITDHCIEVMYLAEGLVVCSDELFLQWFDVTAFFT